MARKRKRRASARRKRRISGSQPAVVSGTRRRKHTKYGTVRKHRRRVKGVGAITGNNLTDTLLGAAIGFGAGVAVDKFIDDSKPVMKEGAKILVGATGAYLGIKKKKPFIKGLGIGLAGQGAYKAAKLNGLIKGVTDFMQGIGASNDDTMLIEMRGIDETQKEVMGALDQQVPVISGSEEGYMMGNDMPAIVQGQ